MFTRVVICDNQLLIVLFTDNSQEDIELLTKKMNLNAS